MVTVSRRARFFVRAGAIMGALAGALGMATLAAVRSTRTLSGETHAADRAPDAAALDGMLGAAIDSLDAAMVALSAQPDIGAFRRARRAYKHLEGVVEYYAPALAAALNGRRQEVDDDDAPPPASLGPSGFPAVEALLFSREGARDSRRMAAAAEGARQIANRLRPLFHGIRLTDAQRLELARQELARVSTLGIAGFDAPLSGDAMRESADALDGLRFVCGHIVSRDPMLHERHASLDRALTHAAVYLRAHADFETFDRLAFLSEYARPAAHALDSLRRATGAAAVWIPRFWRVDVASPYDAGAFDPRAYAPANAPPPTDALIALGRRLFFEPVLSGPRTRSCASCHQPGRAFTDGLPRATAIGGGASHVARNTPTLLNAGLQPAQFADERVVTLEDQIGEVLRSPAEMASSVELAAGRLNADRSYRAAFTSAFHDSASSGIAPSRVRSALAAYVRSLTALHSRFDRAVRGDAGELTREERRGFNLFMGKAQCGTCHFAPLFGGVTPPLFVGSDVEVIGTPVSPTRSARPDPDSGRARIDHLAIHYRAFKTPSLRNVALTAPYMHNGAFSTLRDVIAFYDKGGGVGAGAVIGNQTLASAPLHLSVAEREALIAFLRTLTDTVVAPD